MGPTAAFQAIVFDIGGVLVPLPTADRFHRWEERCGITQGSFAWTVWQLEEAGRALLGQTSTDEVWRAVARRYGLSEHEVGAIVEQFWTYETYDRAVAGLIRSVRSRYRTALLSNAWQGARDQIRVAGLDNLTDHLILSCEEGIAKPDQQIYLTTLERLAVWPEHTLFVDDVNENLQAARDLGMATFHFENAERDLPRLRTLIGFA